MYGTIGRYRVKPGMEAQFRQLFEEQERAFEGGQLPGLVAVCGYRMDADRDMTPMCVICQEDKFPGVYERLCWEIQKSRSEEAHVS
jgi:hypothetical protein